MRTLLLIAIAALPITAQNSAQNSPNFDPHDLSGHWNRTSRFQTFSNVYSGQGSKQGTEEAPVVAPGGAQPQ